MGAKKSNFQDNIPAFSINKKISLWTYFAYGTGHILNDVCAAMWFSYLLVFFHLVLEFESGQAGVLLLVGQVADAIATPIIGYNSDKDHNWWIYKFGKRKIWYFMGTFCVIFAFPFIFSPCVRCQGSSRALQMVYYSFFIIIFQFGWAAVQIAHMSLIPEITFNNYQRTKLAAIRNGATVIASVLVYLVSWGILRMSGESDQKVGPNDVVKFQYIVWSVMAFGIMCSVVFYVFIKEPQKEKLSKNEHQSNECPTFRELFFNINFYFVGCVYMSSRLFINLTQVFISLYLSESLNMVASSLAIIPLAIYVASFIASFPVGPMTKLIGQKLTYLSGALLGLAGCMWIQWGHGDDFKNYFIFVVAALLGSATTIVLVSSLDITTKFIGTKTGRGAFIYGIMSFADKLSNGISVEIIQVIHFHSKEVFYRNVMTYACGGALLLGSVTVLIINNNKLKNRPRNESTETLPVSISSIS